MYQLPKVNAAVLPVGASVAQETTVKKLNKLDVGRLPGGVVVEVAGNRITSIGIRLDAVESVTA